MKKLILAFVVFFAAAGIGQYSERPKNVAKATHLGMYEVAVTCTNGADPTAFKHGDMLIISCTDERQSHK